MIWFCTVYHSITHFKKQLHIKKQKAKNVKKKKSLQNFKTFTIIIYIAFLDNCCNRDCCGLWALWGCCCSNRLWAIISAGLSGLASLFNLRIGGCNVAETRLLVGTGNFGMIFVPAVVVIDWASLTSKSLNVVLAVDLDGLSFFSFSPWSSISGTTWRVPVTADIALLCWKSKYCKPVYHSILTSDET